MSDRIAVHISVDPSPLNECIASLEHFLDVSLEARKRFLNLGDALAQTRSVDVSDSTTGTPQIRVFLEPSDGLRQLLATCLAGDFDDV